jgi:hypothetical protein
MDSKTPVEVYLVEIFTNLPFNAPRHSSPEKNRNSPQPSLVGSLVLSFAANWFIKNHHSPEQSFNQRSTQKCLTPLKDQAFFIGYCPPQVESVHGC